MQSADKRFSSLLGEHVRGGILLVELSSEVNEFALVFGLVERSKAGLNNKPRKKLSKKSRNENEQSSKLTVL